MNQTWEWKLEGDGTRVVYPEVLRGDREEPPRVITIPPKLALPRCQKCGRFHHLVNAQLGCQTSCSDCESKTTGCLMWAGLRRVGQPVERSVFAGDIPDALKRSLKAREEQKQKEG